MKIHNTYLIDDDEIFTILTKIQMEKNASFGSIHAFENGEDALERIKQDLANDSLPDFILLDLNMPIMDGWQFLDAFEKLNIERKIMIYIATSSIDPRDLMQAENYSFLQGYISKPMNAKKLEEILVEVGQL